jgi:beta-xylosidase
MPAPRTARARRRTVAAVVVALTLSGVAAGLGPAADAAVGSDDFRAGQVYRGDFPDPSVTRVGSTYYAFATNTGGKLLPAMTSPDLRTWRARYSNTGKWWQNDALAKAPAWAKAHYANGAWRVSTWAPSVARVGDTFVAAYVAPVSENPRKMCVTLAYDDRPLGLFTDRSTKPFVCAPDQGSIDPEVYVDPRGTPWLLWKNEGIPRHEPTRIWVRRLNGTATGFAAGSTPHNLLTTAQDWEGNVIENPSMVSYGGRTYLLYSANRYSTAQYAIGYAICRGPGGGCHRQSGRPLMASGGSVEGPGGPDAFVGAGGRLRMAYAAWDRGHVGYPATTACRSTSYGCNQRRLHVAVLSVAGDGTLGVADRG